MRVNIFNIVINTMNSKLNYKYLWNYIVKLHNVTIKRMLIRVSKINPNFKIKWDAIQKVSVDHKTSTIKISANSEVM